MKCELIQTDLKAFCDNELPFPRRLAIRRHLAQCPACREEVTTMEKIAENLQYSSQSNEPLSDNLRARILANASQATGSPALPSSPRPELGEGPGVRAKRRLSPLTVAGFCATLALFAFFAMRQGLFRLQPPAPSPGSSGAQDTYTLSKNEAFRSRIDAGGPITIDGQPPAVSTARSVASLARESNAPESTGNSPSAAAPMAAAPAGDLSGDFSLDRQVHRQANVTVQLKDPEAASDQVVEMTKDAGGYVAENDLITDDGGQKSAQMTLKVPVEQFDTVLGQIEKLGNVTAKNVTGQDITGKVSDASQAEVVLEDEVARSNAHLAALGRRAHWADEEDARQVRIELAQARARVQLLHKLAALADITVSLTQTPKPAPPAQTGFLSNLRGNGSAAFQSMLGTLSAVLTALIWILAYIPIWGPLAFAVWYTRRYLRETRA